MKLVLDNGKEIVLSQELASQLEKVVKKEEVKKTGWERVSRDDRYYYTANGNMSTTVNDGDEFDQDSYDNANHFSDKELAEKVAFRQTLERKLMRFSAEHDGDKIDWNSEKGKYFIFYDYGYNDGLLVSSNLTCSYFGGIYFHAIETAKLAIDTFKDDLIKYFTTMSL